MKLHADNSTGLGMTEYGTTTVLLSMIMMHYLVDCMIIRYILIEIYTSNTPQNHTLL